jgi:hypothetical protein
VPPERLIGRFVSLNIRPSRSVEMRRKTIKTEAQKKREAVRRAARELAKTRACYGLDRRQPTEGITPDLLAARSFVRRPKIAPTSDRIPGSAPTNNLLSSHKWKRGAEEKPSTILEIRRKPAHRCGLQKRRVAVSPARIRQARLTGTASALARTKLCPRLADDQGRRSHPQR